MELMSPPSEEQLFEDESCAS
jgi:hypothetical protein